MNEIHYEAADGYHGVRHEPCERARILPNDTIHAGGEETGGQQRTGGAGKTAMTFHDLRRAAHDLEGMFITVERGLGVDFDEGAPIFDAWSAVARHDVDGPAGGYILVIPAPGEAVPEKDTADIPVGAARRVAETMNRVIHSGGVIAVLHRSEAHLVMTTGISLVGDANLIRIEGQKIDIPLAVVLGLVGS